MLGTERSIIALLFLLPLVGCGTTSTASNGFSAGTRASSTADQIKLTEPFICPMSNPENLGVLEPVSWPDEATRWRWGSAAEKFSEIRSSRMVPVERCGARDSYQFLASLRCDDGILPFAEAADVHSSRVGGKGSGGACGFIIDLYEVMCPENTYKIFIDPYHCPQGESME